MERSSAPTDARESRRMLEIYLRDHYGGSTAGLALVRRCRGANRGTAWDGMLAAIEAEITEDQETLESIMGTLGVERSLFKSVLGTVGEMASRLKSNGRLFGYSSLSRLIELEALAAGIETKRNLWRALRHLEDVDVIDAPRLDRLIERATAQLEQVGDLHDRAAEATFANRRAPISEAL
jgi:hypothetical protein